MVKEELHQPTAQSGAREPVVRMGERRKAVRMFVYGKDRISHGSQTERHYIPARRVTRLSFPIQRPFSTGPWGACYLCYVVLL